MKNNKTFLIVLVTAALTLVLACVVITVVPSQHSKAVKYDLNCVTKMNGRPLQDCRVESDKCLFNIEGTNTYELRPWEDCNE